MAHFQSKTPKRHLIFANSTAVSVLNKGKLTFPKNKPRVKTVRKYKNKDGRDCYAGTVHLRATEFLVLNIKRVVKPQAYQDFPRCPIPCRQYPIRFAAEFLRIYLELRRCRLGCPNLTGPVPSACTSVSAAPWDFGNANEFQSADLPCVFRYLRGGKSLHIPEAWKSVVPPSLHGAAFEG